MSMSESCPDTIPVPSRVNLTEKDRGRIFSQINKDGPMHPYAPEKGRCWLWTGGLTHEGYAATVIEGKRSRVHRALFLDMRGGLAPNENACHSCDVRNCCNPDHIFPGTQGDNIRDMVSKNRQATGDRNGSRIHREKLPRGDFHHSKIYPEKLARGSRHGLAKLTESIVLEIRGSALPIYRLAVKFSVSQTTIIDVLNRRTWRHI